jgi:hypothetical protein
MMCGGMENAPQLRVGLIKEILCEGIFTKRIRNFGGFSRIGILVWCGDAGL